jgi:hypothetical protein
MPSRGRHDEGRVDRTRGAVVDTLMPWLWVADLPVLEIVSAVHILADLTLGLGKVVHDYLLAQLRLSSGETSRFSVGLMVRT